MLMTCAVALRQVIYYLFPLGMRKCKLPDCKQHPSSSPRLGTCRELQTHIPTKQYIKDFERVVYYKMSVFLFDVIDPAQFSFLEKHSYLQQLLLMVELSSTIRI